MDLLPCLPPIANTRTPKIPTPAGACDTHFHLFGPRAKFQLQKQKSLMVINAQHVLPKTHASLARF